MTESEGIILKIPMVPDGEATKFRITKKESGGITGYRISKHGREYYKVQLKTESIDGEVTEEASILEITEILKPISRHMIRKGKDGNVLSDTKMNYEGLDLPLNCCTSLGAMDLYLRGGPFIPKSKVSLNILMMDRSFKINGAISKEEGIITVPAGTFECYKVEWAPDISSIMDQLPSGFHFPPGFYAIGQRLISRFMPSISDWYSVEAPHHLIKYEGVELTSSLSMGEPIIEELISIE
jgi:hypothetical protein